MFSLLNIRDELTAVCCMTELIRLFVYDVQN